MLGRVGGRLKAWRQEEVVSGWGARGKLGPRSEDSARGFPEERWDGSRGTSQHIGQEGHAQIPWRIPEAGVCLESFLLCFHWVSLGPLLPLAIQEAFCVCDVPPDVLHKPPQKLGSGACPGWGTG